MTWDFYQVIFKAKAPIHIGYRQIGILKTTRYYIPGRAMWGAITAKLTRTLKTNPSPRDYQVIGDSVKENIRTTYFFPTVKHELSYYSIECSSNKFYVMIPCYKDKSDFKIGKCSKEDFEQLFIGSYISTALSEGNGTAEEGSLHEIELIMDKIKNNDEIVQIYWSGYFFIKSDIYYKSKIENALKNISIGGDRSYGFGKLDLINFSKINSDPSGNHSLFSGSDISVDKNINLNLGKNAISLGHVDLKGFDSASGNIEPLVGLTWGSKFNSRKGAGQQVSASDLCFVPGTCFESVSNLQIGDYGIWKKVD